jgi:hypothetical protein
LAKRPNQKLAFKFFGPFTVLERIGQVAYKLDLPLKSKIHPVFHVSQLKPCIGPRTQVSSTLHPADMLFQVPLRVLQCRLHQHGHSTVVQGLIHWSGSSADQATWEDLKALQHQFPLAPAWGQAGNQGEGIVNYPATPDEDSAKEPEAQNMSPGRMRPKRRKRVPGSLTSGA